VASAEGCLSDIRKSLPGEAALCLFLHLHLLLKAGMKMKMKKQRKSFRVGNVSWQML
jgi:hypothetical protein